jgi:hypothetical protein
VVRLGLWLGFLAGVAYALVRALERRPDVPAAPSDAPWPPLPAQADDAADAVGWVDPVDGACPASHPVKAKLSSKIYHLPGMANYERTNPDRCYLGAAEAEADGLRAAKR